LNHARPYETSRRRTGEMTRTLRGEMTRRTGEMSSGRTRRGEMSSGRTCESTTVMTRTWRGPFEHDGGHSNTMGVI